MKRCYVLTCITSLILSTGCSTLRAKPTEMAVFIPKPELLSEQRNRAPFNGYWTIDGKQYYQTRELSRSVYIAPIDTSNAEMVYKAAQGADQVKIDRIQETQELARYFAEKIKLGILAPRADGELELKPVDSPDQDSIVLHLALTQVIPTNPGVNLVGTAAGFLVPGGGLIKIAGEGSIAMEGFVDAPASPDSLYEEYKDREGQRISPFSLKDYQRYAYLRENIDDWAAQIVELLRTMPEHTVADSDLIELSPL